MALPSYVGAKKIHMLWRCLVDVYFSGRRPHVYCSLCEDSECDHTRFALNIPEALQALKEKGWRIEEGKVLYVPP